MTRECTCDLFITLIGYPPIISSLSGNLDVKGVTGYSRQTSWIMASVYSSLFKSSWLIIRTGSVPRTVSSSKRRRFLTSGCLTIQYIMEQIKFDDYIINT